MIRKRIHPKGVNDVMPRTPGRNASMAQRASLLARLEHKKTLLKTRLNILEMKRSVAERQLRLLEIRIRNARQAVAGADEPAPEPAPEASRRRHDLEFLF